jgi:hypothetical protein
MITVYGNYLHLAILGMKKIDIVKDAWQAPFDHNLAAILRRQKITFYISTEGGLPVVRVEGENITPTLW